GGSPRWHRTTRACGRWSASSEAADRSRRPGSGSALASGRVLVPGGHSRENGPVDALDDPVLLQAIRFGPALALRVLLGLERERTKTEATFAGVRTLGLLALAGGIAAYVDGTLARPWLGLGVFAAVVALIVTSYAITARAGEFGITTELSAMLAF